MGLLGKPLGVTLFAWLAVRVKIADLSAGVGFRQVLGAGCLTAVRNDLRRRDEHAGEGSGSARRQDNYARRRPEETALYQCVAEHRPEFREHVAEQGGLPKFVEEEFDAYLTCGRLEAVASSYSAALAGTPDIPAVKRRGS